jgi:hypothetical protein
MGALIFWLGVGLLLVLVLLVARVVDRRDRRRGHSLRSGGAMARDAWEHRRDSAAGDSAGHLGSDRFWSAHSRQVEGRSHRPDERPEA